MVDNTALGYLMATQDLHALAVEAELKDEGKKKPGPNNPEEVSEFVEQINEAVDKFSKTIYQYEPYSIQDAYSDFVGRYYEPLSKIEDYFVDASLTAVLELVGNRMCKIMSVEMERERKEQELCKDPRVSTDNIMQPHKVMNRLEAMPFLDIFNMPTMHHQRWPAIWPSLQEHYNPHNSSSSLNIVSDH